jgi:hypothetical protein
MNKTKLGEKMSKIAFNSNPLGTGTFTIASPNSNSNRTFTLPDATGTVLTSAGGTMTGNLTVTAEGSAASGSINVSAGDPFIRLHDTNGAADARKWDIRVVGNTEGFVVRSVNDANTVFTTRFSVDPSGRVAMPFQPAFLAVNQSNTFTPNSGIFTNVYTTAKLNRGNHYNTANGRFTAPVSGVYYFLHQMTARTTSNTTYEPKIHVNDVELSRVFTNGGGFGHMGFAMLTIALSAGDFVQAGMYQPGGIVFSGSDDITGGSNGIVSGWMGYLLG